MRRLKGGEHVEATMLGNDCCAACGLHERGLGSMRGGDGPWEHGAAACPECMAHAIPPEGDTHFVVLMPEMTQAQVSHLARAIATAAHGAGLARDPRLRPGGKDPNWYLDLLTEGFARPTAAAGGPGEHGEDLDFTDAPPRPARSMREAVSELDAAAKAAWAAVSAREAAAVEVFGTSSPAAVAAMVSALSPEERAPLEAAVRTVPRRIAVERIKAWKHPAC